MRGKCRYPFEIEESDEKFSSKEYLIIDKYKRATLINVIFQGENCISYKEVYNTVISFNEFNFDKSEDNKYLGAFTVEKVEMTVEQGEEFTKALNKKKFCEYSDWRIGKSKTISSKNCEGEQTPKNGEVISDILKLTPDSLTKKISFNPVDLKELKER